MSRLLLSWPRREAPRAGDPSVWLDLKTGRAGLCSTYRRWRSAIQAIFIVAGIVIIDQAIGNNPFLIASCIFLAIAGTIAVIAVKAYRAAAGRALEDRQGAVAVTCPACGYSMVGLESCKCPECGAAYTIDGLIREQDYAALRRPVVAAEPQKLPALLPEPGR